MLVQRLERFFFVFFSSPLAQMDALGVYLQFGEMGKWIRMCDMIGSNLAFSNYLIDRLISYPARLASTRAHYLLTFFRKTPIHSSHPGINMLTPLSKAEKSTRHISDSQKSHPLPSSPILSSPRPQAQGKTKDQSHLASLI